MGICLDTEQHNESQDNGRESSAWTGNRSAVETRVTVTPPAGKFPMQNTSHVKFETPKVPVIFILGGPGSGKVTHCDNLMQEKRGVIHINMTDLLQQYAIGNDMQDFGSLSSKTVTEVLMLEMKMAPAAKTYLVSGYPRSMRDVAEYSDKIQVVNGVILVNWRQKILERQIEYGARLGHVVLSLARMELNNFYKNVMPVADYFDQSNMLMVVNGERNPGEVYKDFRSAVLRVLGAQENLSAAANGITGAGADGIPGEIVGVEPAQQASSVMPVPNVPMSNVPMVMPNIMPKLEPQQQLVKADVITVKSSDMDTGYQSTANKDPPPTLWVIGGPGSNKSTLCQKAVSQLPGWVHFSVGRSLRLLAEGNALPGSDVAVARQSIAGGEMVPQSVVSKLLTENMNKYSDAKGVVIDGYPRDIEQVKIFENMFQQKPSVILLDCSKLQLGRGRLDDSVAAFRRRLELFRELSLPMLKSLDTEQRLTIVDGDTDTQPVQEDFNRIMLNHMESAVLNHKLTTIPKEQGISNRPDQMMAAALPAINTISQQVQNANNLVNSVKHMANGGLKNVANGHANGMVSMANGAAVGVVNGAMSMANGGIGMANGGMNVVNNGIGMANGFMSNATAKVAPLPASMTNAARNVYQQGMEHLDAHI